MVVDTVVRVFFLVLFFFGTTACPATDADADADADSRPDASGCEDTAAR